jgi:fungalysin metallopeptidase (M36)/proprotein convertase P-domain-containing protein
MSRRVTILAAGIFSVAAIGFAPPGQAFPNLHDEGLPNLDRRAAERAPVPVATRTARADLAEDLGPLGEVRVDPKSGGVAYLGRSDRLLTAPSSRSPREIVLDYVRAHDEVFGLDERDIANLELMARSAGPDGIVHLRFNQVLGGILSFDSGIDGHVTADGRLINVSGAPVPGARLPDTDPALGARAGLREAREAVDGAAVLPATTEVSAKPERTTAFAGGERAVLRWSATADGPRLAWSVIADGGGERFYEVLVDAESGSLLRRQSLTSELGAARYFGVDPLQTPDPIEIAMPPAWYDEHAGGTRLWGQYARTYIDVSNENPAPGAEQGGNRVQVPAGSGAPAAPDWLYEQSTNFPGAKPCPPSGCTWNNEDEEEEEEESEAVNQFQAATNAHVITSRFHDYLEAAPIGFDEASGNFQRTNTSGSGAGNDYVRVEVNDGGGRNNANFFSPPDGVAPRMQLYLRTTRDINSSDQADVIYHEYGHGLSSRLVVTASGSSALTGFQSRMMGEAWSDFYSLDLLVHEGHIADTAAPGEVQLGYYAFSPGGVRYKPIDCPVNPTETTAACNGTPELVSQIRGGYTYGDIVPMYALLLPPPFAPLYNEGPHDGGEIWGQTLWDIRTALGRETALALITGGMRLSVDAPSMLDMRDAILQQAVAMRSAPGAPDDHYEALWGIFAKRGMGADATNRSAGSTTPEEGFGLVSAADSPALADPYPGGDDDGAIEPGEQFEISQELRAVTSDDVAGVTGTLAGGTGGTIVDKTAAWPLLGGDVVAANTDPLVARLAAGCTQSVPMTLSLATPKGPSKVRYAFDKRPSSTETVPIADATGEVPGVTTASFEALGGGNVSDVDLRIGDLRHARFDQLEIELIHDGVSAVLFGGFPWAGQEMADLIFDSDSTTQTYPLGAGTMRGRVEPQPQNALNAFNGHPVAGTWTLRITDDEEGGTGELRRWGIDSPQQACPGKLEIPVAQTEAASGIELEAATLNGTVTPNGRETGLRFAFGPTEAYGETSPTASAGAGDEPVSATLELTGLQPGTTYHYRVEAIREGGQVAVAGADRAFTTASLPGPPGKDPEEGGPPKPPTIDLAPELGEARVTLARAGKRGTRRRASFSFAVSEPAEVTATVTRAVPGIRNGGRCVAVPKRRLPGAKSCTRRLPAAQGTVALPTAGRGTLRLPAAGLGKGRYTATLTAVDAAGNASAPVIVRFTVR